MCRACPFVKRTGLRCDERVNGVTFDHLFYADDPKIFLEAVEQRLKVLQKLTKEKR